MFTGLIETTCTVKSVQAAGGGMHLTIDLGKLAEEAKIGDSITINGVCLTVAKLQSSLAGFDVSSETLGRSTLGELKPASPANVELAMKASDRFGGHIVQGHVDGVATIKAIKRSGQFADITFTASRELLDQMVVKGAIAVDGISLTIANMDQTSFSVAIIPKTLEKTTLGLAKIGDKVNIEIDIITKTIKSELEKILPKQQQLTVERLKELGF